MANTTKMVSDRERLKEVMMILKGKGYRILTSNGKQLSVFENDKAVVMNNNYNSICFNNAGQQVRDAYITWHTPTMDAAEILEVLETCGFTVFQEHNNSYIEIRKPK